MTKERQGELFTLAGGFLWGIFPVIAILSLHTITPLTSLAFSMLFSTLFFGIIFILKKSWRAIKDNSVWKDIFIVAIFNSLLFHALFFMGLKYTSAGNASIIGLSEIFFAFIVFHIWKKDFISKEHIWGAVLMVSGALIVLYPGFSKFQIGDLLILSAAVCGPIGNIFQQRARKKVSSEIILFLRYLMSVPIIFILIYFLGEFPSLDNLRSSIFFVALNGIFILGIGKVLWLEAIHRIDVTKANALSSINPLFTLLFAWILLNDSPTLWQLCALLPMALGIILLSINKQRVAEIISQ